MNENDEDLAESLSFFEAAVSAHPVELPPVALKTILLAIDQSNQDPTAEGLATALARRHGAQIQLIYAYEQGEAEARDRYQSERLHAIQSSGVSATSVAKTPGSSFEQILAAVTATQSDLIIVPAPYLDDLRVLGADSIGVNLDLLMRRSPVPILVVREPQATPAASLKRIVAPLTLHEVENAAAAAWALALIEEAGALELLEVADTESLDAAKRFLTPAQIAEQMSPQILAGKESQEHASLTAAVQKRATERSLGCRVTVQVGPAVKTIAEVCNAQDQLVITGCPSDHTSSAYQRVLAVIRESRNPLLVV